LPIVGACIVPHPPLIMPEVGRGRESSIKETSAAYAKVSNFIKNLKPETIVISSPHTVMYRDYFHISPGFEAEGDMSYFGAPNTYVHVNYDTQLVRAIIEEAKKKNLPVGTLGQRDKKLDHATVIPLVFVQKSYTSFKVVRIGLSGLPLSVHYRVGECIQKASDKLNKRVFYIASGDLSHKLRENGPYGISAEGLEYERKIINVMKNANFEELFNFSEDFCEKAAECGHRSFVMMAGALDGKAVESKLMSHQDITGVGYGVSTYLVLGNDPERCFLQKWLTNKKKVLTEKIKTEDIYVRIARQSIESYLLSGKLLTRPDNLSDELIKKKAGVFVSLHEEGNLRGCIGTIEPIYSCVADEIINNAVSAAVKDPRFQPVSEEEISFLEISVDVLEPAELIQSKTELDPQIYGVIVSKGIKRGLLLPNLKGVDTVEQQIAIAKQKAGIAANDEDVQLKRFKVTRHY
jgi:AmmeMemoRadiSam system protein A/AmmeMemoRadiSam system protein B